MKNVEIKSDEQGEEMTATTGIEQLDRMLTQEGSCEMRAAIYACMEIAENNPELGERIREFLRRSLENETTSIEEVQYASQWLRFMDGYKAANIKDQLCQEESI